MRLRRRALLFPVLRALRTERIAIASPGDFVRGPARAFEPGSAPGLPLPYCLDILRRRSLYVIGSTAEEARVAPFYYLQLRRSARDMVSVPWEDCPLDKSDRAAEAVAVFSPGRVGSTLLSRALAHSGVGSVSEPDFFTQATAQVWSNALNPARQTIRRAVGGLTHDLAASLGHEGLLVIKLRAECCRAPDMVLANGRPRTIFLIRDFESWAASTIRVFRASPRNTVARYLRALRCYAWLSANTRCHLLRYTDLLSNDVKTRAGLARFLGHVISREAFAEAMEEQSQSGTPLEEARRPAPSGFEQMFDGTIALWNSQSLRKVRR